MSWKEKVIGCGSSAGPGLPWPAEGTVGCTATGDRMEFLSLRGKGYPLTWRREMSEVRSDNCKDRGQRTEDSSRHRRQGQRMAGLVAMLVDSISHSRGGIIRREEAIRGRVDEQTQENVMALVNQWRPAARRPPRWPPPDEDSTSRGAVPQQRDVWRPEAWLAAVQVEQRSS
jgi:hypothetical protein